MGTADSISCVVRPYPKDTVKAPQNGTVSLCSCPSFEDCRVKSDVVFVLACSCYLQSGTSPEMKYRSSI